MFAIRDGSLLRGGGGAATPRRYLRSVIIRVRFTKDVAYLDRSVVAVLVFVLDFFLKCNGQRFSSFFTRRQGRHSQTWRERRIRVVAYVHCLFSSFESALAKLWMNAGIVSEPFAFFLSITRTFVDARPVQKGCTINLSAGSAYFF